MKKQTGLKTVNGRTYHTAQVLLFWDDCERILKWLPEGGDLHVELARFMTDAKRDADNFNRRLDEDEKQWRKTGTRSFEV